MKKTNSFIIKFIALFALSGFSSYTLATPEYSCDDIGELEILSVTNDSYAQGLLGFCYYSGKGVKQDLSKSAELFQLPALQKNAYSQYMLGYMYFMGEGVEEDASKAFMWFKESADQGNVDALDILGFEQGKMEDTKISKWVEKILKNSPGNSLTITTQ